MIVGAERGLIPIVFTEMGWQSGGGPPGYEGSDEQQVRFIVLFDGSTASGRFTSTGMVGVDL